MISHRVSVFLFLVIEACFSSLLEFKASKESSTLLDLFRDTPDIVSLHYRLLDESPSYRQIRLLNECLDLPLPTEGAEAGSPLWGVSRFRQLLSDSSCTRNLISSFERSVIFDLRTRHYRDAVESLYFVLFHAEVLSDESEEATDALFAQGLHLIYRATFQDELPDIPDTIGFQASQLLLKEDLAEVLDLLSPWLTDRRILARVQKQMALLFL